MLAENLYAQALAGLRTLGENAGYGREPMLYFKRGFFADGSGSEQEKECREQNGQSGPFLVEMMGVPG